MVLFVFVLGNNITGYDSHNLCLLLGVSTQWKIYDVCFDS